MKRIADKFLLLLYCLFVLTDVSATVTFIFAFYLAIAVVCLNSFLNYPKFHFGSVLFYLVIAFFLPDLYLFLPVILYDLMQFRLYIPLCIGLFGYVINWFLPPGEASWFSLLGCLIALVLQYSTSAYERLDNTYRRTRDDSIEKNLLLKEKNQVLLEKQDYEVYTATLRERNRIAREIHDNVGHMLSRSILMVGAMKAINKEENLKQPLTGLEDTLNTAMNSIRTSVHDLHDESINLKNAARELADGFTFCPVELIYDMPLTVPRELKYSFLAITKEALANIIKHSNATKVQIIMREHPAMYQLVIDDNGTNLKIAHDSGIGLINIKERVAALHGSVRIHTEHGFRIFITIPKTESED